MRKFLIYSVATALLSQNVAYANRIDSAVKAGVANAAQELAVTDQALAVAEEQLLNIENSIIELQQHGKVARYTTIGLAASGIIIGTIGAIAISTASPEKVGTTTFIMASVPAALSGISHVIYGLQKKEINKEEVLAELASAQKQLDAASQVNDPEIKASIQKLQQSLQALNKTVVDSKASGINEFAVETTTMMNAITGLGLVVAGTSMSMNSELGRNLGFFTATVVGDLTAIPALVSALTDNNKAAILDEVQKTRQAVALARKGLKP